MKTIRYSILIIIGILTYIPAIFAQTTNCDDLKIVSAKDVTINCIGSVKLEVIGSEKQNTEILWYTTPNEGAWFYNGPKLETDELTESKTYWVSDGLVDKSNIGGQGKLAIETNATVIKSSIIYYGLTFDADKNFVLKSVDVYPNEIGNLEISLRDASGNTLATKRTFITSTVGSTTIPLDFYIPKGKEYQLLNTSNPNIGLKRDNFSIKFPYKLGLQGELGSITNSASVRHDGTNNNSPSQYYYFYNWHIEHTKLICESERKKISVNVTQDGDELVPELPFSHSENTATYGNILSGTPGEGCGAKESYLNGDEVIYKYEATEDEFITIELSELSKFYSGVFVYESCSDIGVSCLAGYAAGPSMDNILIEDLEVEKGKAYYIVVSSWLTTAIDYKLTIKGFDCSTLEKPLGASTQYFVNGDTLDKLKVEATRPSASIKWYTNAELTNEIQNPSSTTLINGNKYYVTQTFNKCESSALEVTAKLLNCTDLSVVNTTSAEVDCAGSMTLQATPSSIGNQMYWYKDDTTQEIIGRGSSFETPNISQTTSYWVSEAYVKDIEPIEGQGKSPSPQATRASQLNSGLYFNAFKPFKIFDVEVYSLSPATSITIDLIDEADNLIDRRIEGIPTGTLSSPMKHTIPLNFYVPKEGRYRLIITDSDAGFSLLTDTPTGSSFPYPLASFGEVIDGANGKLTTNWYRYFFNWTVGEENIVCVSPRQEVIAKVNQSGDITINSKDLPYIDRSKTLSTNDRFSGTPGINCIDGRYLDGYETIYHYAGEANSDNVLQIQLTDVDNLDAAVFAYSSCGNIGIECIDGATIQDGKATIEDVYVPAGKDILIVVSSLAGDTNYTLSIDGVTCDNLEPPSSDSSPSFIQGETVADLYVNKSELTQEITWYRDANLTDKITTPNTEVLKSGNSYYVTQTIASCESKPLEIVPTEFDPSLIEIDIPNKTNYLCMPGGMITLQATSKGAGNDIYWYDSKTEGNLVGTGEKITVFVEEDTSYWVSVVEKRSQGTPGNKLLDTYCKPYFNRDLPCQNGFSINDFTLKDNSNNVLISHSNTGCSPNGYGNFIDSKHLTTTLYAGQTYNFIATHDRVTIDLYTRIWIDYDGNGSFEDAGEMVYIATEPAGKEAPSMGSFKIPEDISSKNTIIRVKTLQRDPANNNSCTQPTDLGEVHDYKISIIGSDAIYEAPREEVSVIINNSHTREPNVNTNQKLCSNSLLSDIRVLGPNIRWYDSRGNEIDLNTPVTEDGYYYVTQTIKGCESAMKKIYIEAMETSELPEASINQAFDTGNTLDALNVSGTELTWYKDQWKSKELPLSTVLEDQQTYYVTQVEEGKCESDPLGITVHEILDIKDVLFSDFNFYPNPVGNTLYISNAHVIDKIEIYDIAGRNISSHNFNDLNLELDVSELSPGTYLLNIQVENETKNFRIIKK